MRSFPISLLALVPWALSSAATPSSLGTAGTGLFLLTNDNRLASVSDSLAAAPSPPVAVTGLADNDTLVAIDVRPLNQELYGIARNSFTGDFQLYHLSPATGAATAVGPANTIADLGNTPIARYGLEFSPVADRARIVTSSGLNFRMNPNTGVCIDGNAISPDINPDAAINGSTTTVDEAAYTNNIPGAATTTLYTIDSATDAIHIQSNPNGGIQSSPVAVTLGGIAVNFSGAAGFDIAPDADGDGPAVGKAYAALSGIGLGGLYEVNLATGAATLLGSPPGFTLRGLAVRTQIPLAFALDAGGTGLRRFRLDDPASAVSLAVGGLGGGEVLTGIDFRPSTGQLYGLAVNAAADSGSLYLLDPNSGNASAVGSTGQVSFVDNGSNPVDLPATSSGYGVDFNPVVDRLRVVTGTGLNFRVNPFFGTPVDGNAGVPGINTDSAINGGVSGVTAAAYTNSYAGAGTTTLYTLDPISDVLWIQNTQNLGTQTAGVPVTLNGSPLNFTAATGFDITGAGGTALVADAAAAGHGWAALVVGGVAGLYRIDLASGVAAAQGQIGSGAAVDGLAVTAEDGAGVASLRWTSSATASYRIETSEDLFRWQAHPGTVVATGSFTTLPVPLYDGEKRRFWRVILP